MRKIFYKLTFILAVIVSCATELAVANELTYNIEERRQSRGLVEMGNLFVPKGQWIFGATASYSTHINKDYNYLIIEDIISEGYNVTASPTASYAVKDNLTAGIRFEYSRTLLRVDNASVSIGDDMSFDVRDIYSISQSFLGMLTLRQYIPFGSTKRFAMFTEARLGVGGSKSKYAFDSPVQGTYATSTDLSINMVPGIVAFATDNVAFEVTVGVMGISYSHVEQVQNQVYLGSIDNSMMSFKLNLFSIGLGVSFYL